MIATLLLTVVWSWPELGFWRAADFLVLAFPGLLSLVQEIFTDQSVAINVVLCFQGFFKRLSILKNYKPKTFEVSFSLLHNATILDSSEFGKMPPDLTVISSDRDVPDVQFGFAFQDGLLGFDGVDWLDLEPAVLYSEALLFEDLSVLQGAEHQDDFFDRLVWLLESDGNHFHHLEEGVEETDHALFPVQLATRQQSEGRHRVFGSRHSHTLAEDVGRL